MSRGGRMPAPPGQLGRGGPSKLTTAEPAKPKPKPEVQASPQTQLFAELAKRNQAGGSKPMIPNEFNKPDYGVNKSEGFGVTLKKAGDPLSPRPNNPSSGGPTDATSPRKTGGDMFSPVKKEWAYKTNANAGLNALPVSTKDPGSALAWQLSGPEEVLTSDEVEFRLTCKNKETKASFDYDPRKLESEIWPVGKRGAATPAKILKANAGLFILQYGLLRNPGEYEMNIWIDVDRDRRPIYKEDNPIPLLVMGENQVEQEGRSLNFSCGGDGFQGGEVGKTCHFKIYCKDDQHRPVEIDMAKLKVNLSQPGKVLPAILNEDSNGCFSASFKPEQDGEWKVKILFQGQEVVDTKMNITGKTEGSQCYIVKPPKSVKVNTPSSFSMQARDKMGQIMTSGGETFKSSVAGPPGGVKDFMVNDAKDGNYQVKFTLTVVGEYEFNVTLRGKHVDGSPVIIRGTSV